MKNAKFYLVTIISVLLLVVAGIWAYHNYFKQEEVYDGQLIVLKPIDSLITLHAVTDAIDSPKVSLVKGNHIDKEQSEIHAAQTVSNVIHTSYPMIVEKNESKTAEQIATLKNEIEVLSKKQVNDIGLAQAKQKIADLQQKIDILTDKNSNVENEYKKLVSALREMSEKPGVARQKIRSWPAVYETKSPKEKVTAKVPIKNNLVNNDLPVAVTSPKNEKQSPQSTTTGLVNSFSTNDVSLLALTVTDNNKEIETNEADRTDKMIGFITVKANAPQMSNGELVIVVLKPDGTVLQKSSWESGTFNSNDGKKVYSCKLRFTFDQQENKRLSFAFPVDSYKQGNYIMQVYNNGFLIGKIIKKLY